MSTSREHKKSPFVVGSSEWVFLENLFTSNEIDPEEHSKVAAVKNRHPHVFGKFSYNCFYRRWLEVQGMLGLVKTHLSHEEQWNKWFELLLEEKEFLCGSQENLKLIKNKEVRDWLHQQKRQMKRSLLCEERETKLLEMSTS